MSNIYKNANIEINAVYDVDNTIVDYVVNLDDFGWNLYSTNLVQALFIIRSAKRHDGLADVLIPIATFKKILAEMSDDDKRNVVYWATGGNKMWEFGNFRDEWIMNDIEYIVSEYTDYADAAINGVYSDGEEFDSSGMTDDLWDLVEYSWSDYYKQYGEQDWNDIVAEFEDTMRNDTYTVNDSYVKLEGLLNDVQWFFDDQSPLHEYSSDVVQNALNKLRRQIAGIGA
jgi:hypothetical protein